jgi:hypothetical protein
MSSSITRRGFIVASGGLLLLPKVALAQQRSQYSYWGRGGGNHRYYYGIPHHHFYSGPYKSRGNYWLFKYNYLPSSGADHYDYHTVRYYPRYHHYTYYNWKKKFWWGACHTSAPYYASLMPYYERRLGYNQATGENIQRCQQVSIDDLLAVISRANPDNPQKPLGSMFASMDWRNTFVPEMNPRDQLIKPPADPGLDGPPVDPVG